MICYSYKKSYCEIVNIVIVNKNIWTYHVVGHCILENNEMEKKIWLLIFIKKQILLLLALLSGSW